ncbi:hypothetical protein V8G54_033036 [Vigna mungo]|uniref:Uncharacterized protein n=1 Tax=Vigna mungo TaxID=3915 RepID=A0AAQ3RFW6_VIGMU
MIINSCFSAISSSGTNHQPTMQQLALISPSFSLSTRSFFFPLPLFSRPNPNFFRLKWNKPSLTVRNCSSSSFKVKPSSEIRKPLAESQPDAKLTALRRLFSKPGVDIDAYVIPSQDAHQVCFASMSLSM